MDAQATIIALLAGEVNFGVRFPIRFRQDFTIMGNEAVNARKIQNKNSR